MVVHQDTRAKELENEEAQEAEAQEEDAYQTQVDWKNMKRRIR